MPIPPPEDPRAVYALIGAVFGGGAFATIAGAIIGAIPSSRAARIAAKTYELERKKAEDAAEKAVQDGLRADLLRITAERDHAEAERDRQRERADRIEHEHHMRLAGCQARGNMCLIPPPPGPSSPSEKHQ